MSPVILFYFILLFPKGPYPVQTLSAWKFIQLVSIQFSNLRKKINQNKKSLTRLKPPRSFQLQFLWRWQYVSCLTSEACHIRSSYASDLILCWRCFPPVGCLKHRSHQNDSNPISFFRIHIQIIGNTSCFSNVACIFVMPSVCLSRSSCLSLILI